MTPSSSPRSVGYIGMGIMGAAMAANLLNAGHAVTVWNRTNTKCAPLQQLGATIAETPAALAAAKPEVIFINVTDTADVEAVLFGPQGIAGNAAEGLIVVDNSTVNPLKTQEFAARLAGQGVTLLDAPVSGGDVGAKNGTLSIMCGGDEDAFQKVYPLFEALGKLIVRVGPSGAGQACKACNQIAVACNLLATCEALALAKSTGLDLNAMVQVVSGGAGGSWQLANLGPKIAKGDYAPGFMIDLILKDLAIVLDTARESRLPLAATALAHNYFLAAAADGSGALGTQAVAGTVEKLGKFSYSGEEA